jgi:hypothetical protein
LDRIADTREDTNTQKRGRSRARPAGFQGAVLCVPAARHSDYFTASLKVEAAPSIAPSENVDYLSEAQDLAIR